MPFDQPPTAARGGDSRHAVSDFWASKNFEAVNTITRDLIKKAAGADSNETDTGVVARQSIQRSADGRIILPGLSLEKPMPAKPNDIQPEKREKAQENKEPARPSDSRLDKPVPHLSERPARVFELNRLENRSANHGTPDAIVRLPENFDPNKPINVVIYNHGFRSNVRSSFQETAMDSQMKNAPANTVLIMPEWQAKPASESSNQGRFSEPGRFKAMMQEVFDKTPGLAGKSFNEVANISIVAHSAGYGPAETEIYKNGLGHKVNSITLLDALYDNHGFDRWLKDNIHDLSSGRKQFNNFYSGTSGNSTDQANRIKQMLKGAGLSESGFFHERSNGQRVLEPGHLAAHSIVFKYSNATVAGLGAHMSMPNLYIGRVLKAGMQ